MKVKRVLGIIVILALLIGSVPFLRNTGLVLAQDTPPEKGTTGEMTVRPAKMVLESPVEISRAEPVKETVTRQAGWQNIMTDGFEGDFPGVWGLYLGAGATDAYWGKDGYRYHSGSYSAFCAKNGSAGVNPPNHYPNNMSAWMVYGPFNLSDATDAELNFWLWLRSESNYDFISCMASIDGIDFYGTSWHGTSLGWVSMSFDLTNVYTLGNLCGESQVWIAFIFDSDYLYNYDGAFVDDVALRKYATAVEPTWTFMVYLDGDNDLEESEIGSFNLMELAANNANVNIVVQIDRTPGFDTSNGDWTTTRRYKVKHDTHPVNFASYTEGVDYWDLGELNMADPNTLIDFVQWAKSNYPADHYCLALSNHGSGWKPRGSGQIVPRGILVDDTDEDYMSTAELSSALNSATSGGTEKLDVLFLDACLMQMIEVGYEVKDYSQYLVTSEYISWGPGPYHAYISSITSTTTAPQLATAIVNEYHSYWSGTICAHTMSAVDLAQFGLASVVDDFAQELTTGLSTYRTEIENSRTACQKFDVDSYIDLYHFAFLINQNIADATIQNAAQAVMTAVNNAVIAEAHENGSAGNYYPLDNANGISIYFPAEGDYDPSNYNSGNLAFVADKGWDEFLAALFGEAPPTVVSIPDASANTCSTVVVPVNITNVTDLGAADIWLSYDKDVVIVDSVANGDLGAITFSIDNTAGMTKMNWFSATGASGDFIFAYVTLHAVGDPGDTSPLDLDVQSLVDTGDIPISHSVENGLFTVRALMEGDVSMNDHVTISDAMFIAQHLVGIITLNADQLESADTTDDGNVTISDAMHIAQWLVDAPFKPLWELANDSHMLQPQP